MTNSILKLNYGESIKIDANTTAERLKNAIRVTYINRVTKHISYIYVDRITEDEVKECITEILSDYVDK